jgi:hypothetical protein
MDHDIRLERKDGFIRYFRVYGRPVPKEGEIVTLPIDGKLVRASVKGSLQEPEATTTVDAEGEGRVRASAAAFSSGRAEKRSTATAKSRC